jgi:hypothetical protein
MVRIRGELALEVRLGVGLDINIVLLMREKKRGRLGIPDLTLSCSFNGDKGLQ